MNQKKQKVEEIVNSIINTHTFVILIGVIILIKTIVFYKNTIAMTDSLEMKTILGTISFITILVCFLVALTNRTRVICTIIIDVMLSILLFADNLYYTYSNSLLSVAQITNLQYGGEIIKTLPVLLELKQVLYFIDIIILILLFAFRIIILKKKEKSTNKKLIIKISIILAGVVIFCIIGLKYIENGIVKSYNKDFQIQEATVYGYHIGDIYNAINAKRQTKYKDIKSIMNDYEQLKNEYKSEYGEIKYNFEEKLNNKNVIILQLESVQEFVVNKEINGKEITPNLNKFLQENIQFTNMHMQSYSTTADSEHTTITSLYPMENGMAFSKYYTNTYDDVFKIFNKENYYTSYMHGNYPYFWNRGNVYGKLNVDDLSLKNQFDDLSENINGDLSDELLYRQAVQKMKKYNNPFISYIVAASSHTPFTLEGLKDRSKVTIDVGKYKDTYFGNYLEAVNYADYAFGVLIEELKNEGLYENTGILVFGDHNGLTMNDEEMKEYLEQTMNKELTEIDLKLNYTRVLCGMKIPGVKNIKIEKNINKLDIKPTLCYLCNIQDGISLGTNMFASKDFICLNNERIITKEYYFDEEWYDKQTGEKLDKSQLDSKTRGMLDKYYEYMKTELDISNSIIINNLLK